MKVLRITASVFLCVLGFWVAAYGGIGALFVLGANDGTPKSAAALLAMVALGGVALMAAGVWVIIRNSR